MENPDSTNKDFEKIFGEIMSDDSVEVFGAVKDVHEAIPELFSPRSLEEYKKELQTSDDKADVDHLTDFDVLLSDMSGVHAKRMNRLLGNLPDNTFILAYDKLLKYAKPSKKAIDIETHAQQELTQINVNVINSKDEITD